jgi:hypothetical protein
MEKALQAQEAWRPSDDKFERSPIARWEGAQNLQVLAKIYRKSKKPAILLEALYLCALNDFVIPKWCALDFIAAFRRVKGFKAKSWDDVFGLPHPKGTHLHAKRQKREKSFVVFNVISEIKQKNPDEAIDGALFEKVGRKLAIGGKTLVEEYYYSAKKFIEDIKKIDN